MSTFSHRPLFTRFALAKSSYDPYRHRSMLRKLALGCIMAWEAHETSASCRLRGERVGHWTVRLRVHYGNLCGMQTNSAGVGSIGCVSCSTGVTPDPVPSSPLTALVSVPTCDSAAVCSVILMLWLLLQAFHGCGADSRGGALHRRKRCHSRRVSGDRPASLPPARRATVAGQQPLQVAAALQLPGHAGDAGVPGAAVGHPGRKMGHDVGRGERPRYRSVRTRLGPGSEQGEERVGSLNVGRICRRGATSRTCWGCTRRQARARGFRCPRGGRWLTFCCGQSRDSRRAYSRRRLSGPLCASSPRSRRSRLRRSRARSKPTEPPKPLPHSSSRDFATRALCVSHVSRYCLTLTSSVRSRDRSVGRAGPDRRVSCCRPGFPRAAGAMA